jgi:2-dehydro-3-deoxygluconokinase
VNYRVSLWRGDEDPGATLLALARRCDLVFVGDDEAEAVWGITGGPAAVRAALPEPRLLVVKQGATGVTVFHRPEPAPPYPARDPAVPAREHAVPAPDQVVPAPFAPDTVTFVPALRVDVVAAVGAGDAFAAGFLSATLRGLPVRDRIRHGHLMAAAVLTAPGDLGTGPTRDHADRLAALDDEAWGTLRLGPGWTDKPDAPATGVPAREHADVPAREHGADEEAGAP